MLRTACIALLAILVGCMLVAPLFAADFAPIFPKQGAPVVTSPNFTWAAGEYDYFVLYLRLPIPIPGYWYTPIPVPLYQQPFWKCPDALWDYLLVDRWCLWRVLAVNTTTHAYELTSWQYFQKVNDCVVNFQDANLEESIRVKIGIPYGNIMASKVSSLMIMPWDGQLMYEDISDVAGLEYSTNLPILYLYGNQIVDVSPLAGLTNLTNA